MDRKTWEPLLRFESRDFLAKVFRQRYDRQISAKQAIQIGASFMQGRQYFASASVSADLVKPLLQFYGVTALCRGLILLRSPTIGEEALPRGHGLTTSNWQETLSNGIAEILELKVSACGGTFTEFVKAIGNRQSYSWFHGNTTGGFGHDFGKIKYLSDGSHISLNDILSRDPSLFQEHSILGDITPGVMDSGNKDSGLVVAKDDGIEIHFELMKGREIEEAIAAYNFPNSREISVSSHPRYPSIPQMKTVCVKIPCTGEDRKKYAPMFVHRGDVGSFLIRPMSNGDNFIDIHRMYIGSYILGMMCRYFPSQWVSLLNSQKGDLARSVVITFMYNLDDAFPKLVRNHVHL